MATFEMVSQALTLFTTPIIYIYMDKLGRLLRSKGIAHASDESQFAKAAE